MGVADPFQIVLRYPGHRRSRWLCDEHDNGSAGWYRKVRLTSAWAARASTCQKEGVVRVARRVLLRLEQGVKVPEAALHVVVGRHLLEAHLGEDLPELRPDLACEPPISC